MPLQTQQALSPAVYLASLSESQRKKLLRELPGDEAYAALLYDWQFWARPQQLPPHGNWRRWLYLAGRGSGKTRAGAEWVRQMATKMPGSNGALVAATPADVRDIMVEGPSGILNVCPPWDRPTYEPSKRKLTWRNGTAALLFSAFEPAHLRGPNHHWAWADELVTWKKLPDKIGPESGRKDNPWHMLMLGLRLGDSPQCVITTTPKPIPIIRNLIKDEKTIVTRGSTYDNELNLAKDYLDEILTTYEGTSLGRQEIYAEVLDEAEGALWTYSIIGRTPEPPELVRIVAAIDPSGGVSEIGIITAGLGSDGLGYVLEDSSLRASPDAWATAAITDYNKFKADRIVAERNFGGEMVEHTIRMTAEKLGCSVSYKDVTASRGKQIRAEPIAALYEQGRVKHVGTFPALEGEMTSWVPGEGESPNRLDALVWALTELMIDKPGFGAMAW